MTRLVKKIHTVPSLTREYNIRGRHPLQGIKRVYNDEHHDAGNMRFGLPMATIAVIAGALSYALVDRPISYRVTPATDTSVIALNTVEPAAGDVNGPEPIMSENGELVMDMAAPPSNRKLITVNDLDDSGVLADEAAGQGALYDDRLQTEIPFNDSMTAGRAPIMDGGGYYDAPSGASPSVTAATYRAADTPASRSVSVHKRADATDYRAMLASADRALALGQYDSAIEMYENLRKDRADDVRVLMGLAVAQQRHGLREAAQATYENVLAADPDNTEATVNMLGLIQNDRPEEAFSKLSTLWSKNPRSPAIAAQLGLVSAQMGKADEAMRYVGIAASLEPRNAGHFYNMAVISDRRGGRGRAIELYERALEIDAAYGAGKSVPREMIYDRLYYLRRL